MAAKVCTKFATSSSSVLFNPNYGNGYSFEKQNDRNRFSLGQAMKMNRSKFANMQIVNRERNTLEIVNQRGFKREFLEHFSVVSADDGSACGSAMGSKNTVFISDAKTEESFAPHLQVALNAGFRAVQSTPLISSRGSVIGVISTHFNLPNTFTKKELETFESFCCRAADIIEAFILN